MPPPVPDLHTARLVLRRLHAGDAPFIYQLLNEPSWLQYIGDRGIRTLEDAVRYIETGPLFMYERYGLGLYHVRLAADGQPVGVCGLLKRESLEDVDLGFALLPGFRGEGYAREAAAAVLSHGRTVLGLQRIVAIVLRHNAPSRRLLEGLGFRLERPVRLVDDREELLLYACEP
jgi:RimJ/RimL family protein N-acetyltransferase